MDFWSELPLEAYSHTQIFCNPAARGIIDALLEKSNGLLGDVVVNSPMVVDVATS